VEPALREERLIEVLEAEKTTRNAIASLRYKPGQAGPAATRDGSRDAASVLSNF
jgi:hypothetical protein